MQNSNVTRNNTHSSYDYEEVLSHMLGPPASEVRKVFNTTPKGHGIFAMPRELSTCLICFKLEKKGHNKNLFEDHYCNFPTHCHRWSELTIEERLDISREAQFCTQWLDPKVVFKKDTRGVHNRGAKCFTFYVDGSSYLIYFLITIKVIAFFGVGPEMKYAKYW
jgi:hypothetical protein